jgi:hypothetical protein
MNEDERKNIMNMKSGIFNDLTSRIKLIMRLIADPRVSPFLKILPIGSLFYFIIPDIALGPIDDVAVMWLGTFLFVELCPPHIVQEHMDSINQTSSSQQENNNITSSDIIDAEFSDPEE